MLYTTLFFGYAASTGIRGRVHQMGISAHQVLKEEAPGAHGSTTKWDDVCKINWEELAKAGVNQKGFNPTELIQYVAGRMTIIEAAQKKNYDHTKISAEIQKRVEAQARLFIENANIENVPGLTNWYDLWQSAISKSGSKCQAKLAKVKFQVDVFVQQPETPRSHTTHFHPMPLITNSIPVDASKPIPGLPKALVSNGQAEVNVIPQSWVPLASGYNHHEQEAPENRIFIVVVPLSEKVSEFREVRRRLGKEFDTTDKNGTRVRTAETWKKIDTLEGKVTGFDCESADIVSCAKNELMPQWAKDLASASEPWVNNELQNSIEQTVIDIDMVSPVAPKPPAGGLRGGLQPKLISAY